MRIINKIFDIVSYQLPSLCRILANLSAILVTFHSIFFSILNLFYTFAYSSFLSWGSFPKISSYLFALYILTPLCLLNHRSSSSCFVSSFKYPRFVYFSYYSFQRHPLHISFFQLCSLPVVGLIVPGLIFVFVTLSIIILLSIFLKYLDYFVD